MTTGTPKPNPPAGYVPILGDVGDQGEVRLYPGARETLEARRAKPVQQPNAEAAGDN